VSLRGSIFGGCLLEVLHDQNVDGACASIANVSRRPSKRLSTVLTTRRLVGGATSTLELPPRTAGGVIQLSPRGDDFETFRVIVRREMRPRSSTNPGATLRHTMRFLVVLHAADR
jgi:hypothetical protein